MGDHEGLGLLLTLWTLEEKEEELQQREYLAVPGSTWRVFGNGSTWG